MGLVTWLVIKLLNMLVIWLGVHRIVETIYKKDTDIKKLSMYIFMVIILTVMLGGG